MRSFSGAVAVSPAVPSGRRYFTGTAGTSTSVSANAAARVEYALRADDQLSEADIREVMLSYLGARQRRSTTPRRVTRIG